MSLTSYDIKGKSPFAITMMIIAAIKRKKPRPMCAKCLKVVDEFELVTTPDEVWLRFTAYCHGKRQAFDIHKGYFLYADGFEVGRAFENEETVVLDYVAQIEDGR